MQQVKGEIASERDSIAKQIKTLEGLEIALQQKLATALHLPLKSDDHIPFLRSSV